jgi:hypothetical protein
VEFGFVPHPVAAGAELAAASAAEIRTIWFLACGRACQGLLHDRARGPRSHGCGRVLPCVGHEAL